MARAKSAAAPAPSDAETSAAPNPDASAAVLLALHLIDEDLELNPRVDFDSDAAKAALDELAASIGDKGVLQPIMVRPSPKPGRYRIVMGARRFRAALQAGLLTIPAVVKDLDDDKALEAAVVENVQRQDMNAMEEAHAYERMIANRRRADPELSLRDAKEAVAVVVKKGVRMIELRLQLLTLPPIQQLEIAQRKLSAKDAIEWQREQPEPLTAASKLILAEFFDKLQADPHKTYAGQIGDRVEVRATTVRTDKGENGVSVKVEIDDPALKPIMKATPAIFNPPSRIYIEQVESGRHVLALRYYYGERAIKEALPGIDKVKARAALIASLRAEVLGEEAAVEIPPDRYATAWLNGPFETAPEVQAEIDAKLQERKERDAQYKRDQDAREQAVAQAKAATAARIATIAAGEAPLREAADLDQLRPALCGLAAEAGAKLPWFMRPDGRILDAEGGEILDTPYYALPPDALARRRLIVVIANGAAGLATPDSEARPPSDAPPRERFVAMVADYLAEDAEDLPEDPAEALFEATERAGRGLDAFLAAEAIEYGDPAYDWEDDGAMSLAQGILEDGLGQAAPKPPGDDDGGEGGEQQGAEPDLDDEDAAEPFAQPAHEDEDEDDEELEDAAGDDDEPPAFLQRFAGVPAQSGARL